MDLLIATDEEILYELVCRKGKDNFDFNWTNSKRTKVDSMLMGIGRNHSVDIWMEEDELQALVDVMSGKRKSGKEISEEV